jgi:hypothetical protein
LNSGVIREHQNDDDSQNRPANAAHNLAQCLGALFRSAKAGNVSWRKDGTDTPESSVEQAQQNHSDSNQHSRMKNHSQNEIRRLLFEDFILKVVENDLHKAG